MVLRLSGLVSSIPQTPSQAPSTFLNIIELAAACVPPSIRITVVSPGTADKNTTTQLSIPIFTDCNYQKSTPVTPAQNSAAPSSAISSSADYDQYVDANGNPLDKNSMNQLLQFFGDVVNLDVLLDETACAITDTNNNVDTIQSDNETQQWELSKCPQLSVHHRPGAELKVPSSASLSNSRHAFDTASEFHFRAVTPPSSRLESVGTIIAVDPVIIQNMRLNKPQENTA